MKFYFGFAGLAILFAALSVSRAQKNPLPSLPS